MHNTVLTLTLIALCCATWAAEYACDFDTPPDTEVWDLHAAGDGIAKVSDGSLLLDMTAPTVGKHAWADLKTLIKLPADVEWDQQIAQDSDHYYLSGLWIGTAGLEPTVAGLTGKPLGNIVHMSGARGDKAVEPGRWYHFRMHAGTDYYVALSVSDRETGETISEFQRRVGGLRGRLCFIGFYHNQGRRLGPDEYTQNRGASRFDNLKVSAAALAQKDIDKYRDNDLRGYDTRQPMTYNRATVWLGEAEDLEDAVLAYDRAAQLPLTGSRQVASWQPNRLCEMRDKDAATSTFIRPNDLDGYDCAAVRSFQWNVRQHPVLEYEIAPHSGQCYLAVTMVCPYLGAGIQLFRTDPSDQPTHGTQDLAELFRQRGLDYHQFAEIGVFVYQDRPKGDAETGTADVALKLTGPGALLTTPDVLRTQKRAREGVAIHAALAGADGELRHQSQLRSIEAALPGNTAPIPLSEVDESGVFKATLQGLPQGTTPVRISAVDADGKTWQTDLRVTVTDGDFARWEPDQPTYQLSQSGRVLPCLLGDLYAWVPMLDPAGPDRKLVPTAADWSALPEKDKSKVRLIKLRTLNLSEIREQLQVHHDNGMRVIRLTPNVTPHESYLDAGGHVSMHGLEVLQAVLDECRRLDMKALINLFHYPYGSSGTGRFPAWQQYIDAGYATPTSFQSAEMRPMLKQYLRELLLFLRDDPAVLGYSLTGENDQIYGPAFINDLFDHVMACDPNHMVTQEQGGGIERVAGGSPWGYDAYKPTKSAGLGYRTYYTGGLKSDCYFMVCARAYGCNRPVFCAEFASGPGWYGGLKNWVHPDFLSKVRDNCWTSLIGQQTMCMSWSAPWTQEERLIPHQCAEQIDWGIFKRHTPDVGVLITTVDKATLARLGVDYDLLWEDRSDQAGRDGYRLLIDAREDVGPLSVPAEILAARPVLTTGEYSVNYLLAESRDQMIAFIKNTAEYKLGPGYGHGVNELHRQRTQESRLAVTLRGFAGTCGYALYDVDERRLMREGACDEGAAIDLGATCHDYAVVVTPGR